MKHLILTLFAALLIGLSSCEVADQYLTPEKQAIADEVNSLANRAFTDNFQIGFQGNKVIFYFDASHDKMESYKVEKYNNSDKFHKLTLSTLRTYIGRSKFENAEITKYQIKWKEYHDWFWKSGSTYVIDN